MAVFLQLVYEVANEIVVFMEYLANPSGSRPVSERPIFAGIELLDRKLETKHVKSLAAQNNYT